MGENIFGKIIKEARQEAKLTQREAAKEIGISYSYLSQLEGGRNVNVALNTIYKISYVLEIPFACLIYVSDFDTSYKPKFDYDILAFLRNDLVAHDGFWRTFPEFKKVFADELTLHHINDEKAKILFDYMLEAKMIERQVVFGLSKEAEKNFSFLKENQTTNEDDLSQKNSLKVTPFIEITFKVPTEKTESDGVITIKKTMSDNEAIESFFDIENLLSKLTHINYKGNKPTNEQKQRIIESIELIMLDSDNK